MLTYPLMIGTWEIVAIVLVVLLLFGGKKIPELMKGLGQGVKSFKQGMNEVEKEIKEVDNDYNKEEKQEWLPRTVKCPSGTIWTY